MEEKLVARLESAVARLEALSSSGVVGRDIEGLDASSSDPSILAFDDLIRESFGKLSAAAEKIGGQVLQVTKLLGEAFSVEKELLIKIKQTKKPDMSGFAEFLRPLKGCC
ncbi:Cyclase-associated protein 1 [Linum perenne]